MRRPLGPAAGRGGGVCNATLHPCRSPVALLGGQACEVEGSLRTGSTCPPQGRLGRILRDNLLGASGATPDGPRDQAESGDFIS